VQGHESRRGERNGERSAIAIKEQRRYKNDGHGDEDQPGVNREAVLVLIEKGLPTKVRRSRGDAGSLAEESFLGKADEREKGRGATAGGATDQPRTEDW